MLRESETDRCPGALRPWKADDGLIVRVRLAGGRISAAQLLEVSALAQEFGRPDVHITSRGSLQIRGLGEDSLAEVQRRLDDARLLPSSSHERTRNIVASPDRALDRLVEDLDAAITASTKLQDLSGRFVFALATSDGVGLDAPFDLAFQQGTGESGTLIVDGSLAIGVSSAEAVTTLVSLAETFVDSREDDSVWNVRDLPVTSAFFEHAVGLGRKLAVPARAGWPTPPVSVGAPLGLLAPVAVQALCEGTNELVIMPNRTVMLRRDEGDVTACELDTKPLYVAGLIVDAHSAYNQISACVGAPACRRTEAATVTLAHDLAFASQDAPALPRVHISGCERQCGKPQGRHVAIINPQSFADIEAEVHIGA